jgi:hypothetical protein
MVSDLLTTTVSNLTDLLNPNSGQTGPFGLNQDLMNFCHHLPRNFEYQSSVNELSFLLITHTTYFDARFDSYGILKSGWDAENFLDRLGRPANDQVLGQKMHESWQGLCINSVDHWLSFSTPTHTNIFGNHSSGYIHFNTATCGVQQIAIKQNRKRFGFGFWQRWDYNF